MSAKEWNVEEGLGSLLVPERLGTWVWVFAYATLLTMLSVLRYRLWIATGWDLGFYEQGLWGLWHEGLHAWSTMANQPYLSDTGSLFSIVLSPFFVWGGVGFLFVAQSLALGLGYWWIARIGQQLNWPGLWMRVVGLGYLMFPVIWSSNLFDFHPDVMAVPLLFGAIAAVLNKRWWTYAVYLFLAMTVKDTVAIVGCAMGITLIFQRHMLLGIITALGSLGWLLFIVLYFIPSLSHQPPMVHWGTYYGQWGSPAQAVATWITHPWSLFFWAKNLRAWEYLVWIFGPVVALLAGLKGRINWWLLPAFAIIESNLLSHFPAQLSPFNQYSLCAVPFLFLGIAPRTSVAASAMRTKAGVLVSLLFLVGMAVHLKQTTWRNMPSDVANIEAATALIPGNAPVVAQNLIVPHVAGRASVYVSNQLGTMPLEPGSFVILDPNITTGTTSTKLVQSWQAQLSNSKDAKRVYNQKNVTVFEIIHGIAKVPS